MYLKRQNIGKFWTVQRKGTKYLAVSTHNKSSSIPLIVVMRDILKLVRNKKELKKIINEKQILVNNKKIKETNYPVCLFDIISFSEMKKNYKAVFNEHKKMSFIEIPDDEAEKKIFKVIGKKVLKGNKIQINLSQGMNLLVKGKVNIDDSVVFNTKQNKIEKIIKMEKGKRGYVLEGKHIGIVGEIDSIIERGGKRLARIIENNKKINVWVKNVIVME